MRRWTPDESADDSSSSVIRSRMEELIRKDEEGAEIDPEDVLEDLPSRVRERFREYFEQYDAVERLLSLEKERHQRVGRYSILGEIGRGGMGIVYEAIDDRGETVALKMLPVDSDFESSASQRLERESELLSDLNHPAIVPFRESGCCENKHFLVMDFLSGGSLRDRIRSAWEEPSRLSTIADLRSTCSIMANIAWAVSAAHERGVIHRDIKPTNILFDSNGRPFLVDFGLAQLEGRNSLTTQDRIMGTAPYMAPERLDGMDAPSPRIDIYSFGVTLFEALTSTRPFRGELNDILRKVRIGPPSLASHLGRPIAPSLEAIVEKCLAGRPQDRYPTMKAVAEDLERFLEGEPAHALRGRRWRRMARSIRRHPVKITGAIGGIVLVVGAWMVAEHARALKLTLDGEDRYAAFERLRNEAGELPANLHHWEKQIDGEDLRRIERGVQTHRQHAATMDSEIQEAELYFREAINLGDPGGLASSKYSEMLVEIARWREQRGDYRLAERAWNRAFEIAEIERPRAQIRVTTTHDATFVLSRYERMSESTVWPLIEIGTGVMPFERSLPAGSYRLTCIRRGQSREIHIPFLLDSGADVAIDGVFLPDDEMIGEDWVYVPKGPFIAGGDPWATGSAPRSVKQEGGFFIKRKEEVFGDYYKFLADPRVEEGKCPSCWSGEHSNWGDWNADGLPYHSPREAAYAAPVILKEDIESGTPKDSYFHSDRSVHSICPYDADHYVDWLNRCAADNKDNWVYDLPTESQWEKAARGADGRFFAWGDRFDWSLADGGLTAAVKSLDPYALMTPGRYPTDCSPFGVLDMVGCVREICQDEETVSLFAGADIPRKRRLIRGGEESFFDAEQFRLAARRGAGLRQVNWNFGIRLVRVWKGQ